MISSTYRFLLLFLWVGLHCNLFANASHTHTPLLGFKTLKDEHHQMHLETKGCIPEWLSGSLIAVGPSVFELNASTANYWLDAFAMAHAFAINDCKVSYTNKLINSFYYQDCCSKGKLRGSSPEKKSTWAKLTAALSNNRPVYDNANMNLAIFNNELVALTETPLPQKLHATTLETKGTFAFNDPIDAQFASSHLIFDSHNKEWIGLAIHFSHTSDYIIYKMSAHSNVRIPLAKLSVGYPAYMHSFAVSPSYIILTESPMTVSPYDLLLSDHSFIGTFKWQPKNGTNFIVLDKNTGKKIGTFKTEPFFTLHHVNAFEKDGNVYVDLIAYKDPSIVTQGFNYGNLTNLKGLPSAYLKRFTINIPQKTVQSTQLSNHPIEMPQINPHNLMHEYQYLFAATGNGISQEIIKLDLKNHRHLLWQSKGCYVTEAVFVPKPGSTTEDEGVLLSIVLDSYVKKSFLLILDAKTMKELSRTYVPHHIPFTVHSKFFNIVTKGL